LGGGRGSRDVVLPSRREISPKNQAYKKTNQVRVKNLGANSKKTVGIAIDS